MCTMTHKPISLNDVHDKLNEIKGMIAFMGYALLATMNESQPANDDEKMGGYLFHRYIEDEVTAAQHMLDEYETTLKED